MRAGCHLFVTAAAASAAALASACTSEDGVDYYINAARHSKEELLALLARY